MTILRLFPPLPRPAGAPAPVSALEVADADLVIARFVEILSRVVAPAHGAAPMSFANGPGPIAREKIR